MLDKMKDAAKQGAAKVSEGFQAAKQKVKQAVK